MGTAEPVDDFLLARDLLQQGYARSGRIWIGGPIDQTSSRILLPFEDHARGPHAGMRKNDAVALQEEIATSPGMRRCAWFLLILPPHLARIERRLRAGGVENVLEKLSDAGAILGPRLAEIRLHAGNLIPSMTSSVSLELRVCVPNKPGLHCGRITSLVRSSNSVGVKRTISFRTMA